MKIAILGDTHIGASKHDTWIEENQREFFFEFFFPKLKEEGVSTIIQTGDFFDDRSAIRHPSITLASDIINEDTSLEWHVIVGNHDMHKREVIHPNAVSEILSKYKNVSVYDKPKAVDFDGTVIDFIPWICKENEEEINNYIATSQSPVCVGHFELNGFSYYPGIAAKTRFDPKFLHSYSKVLSGHYHTISTSADEKIVYVGTPYTLTFNDANDARGFHIFDTETLELTFHENPMCHHIRFDFDADTFEEIEEKGSPRQKLWISVDNPVNKKRKVDFNKFLESITSDFYHIRVDYNSDLQFVEDTINEADSEKVGTKTSIVYIQEFISELDVDEVTTKRLLSIVNELYSGASEELAGVNI